MATQEPSNSNNPNNTNFNTADLASQLSFALNLILDALSDGSIRIQGASEEFSRAINEAALKMSDSTNDLDSQCRILAETIIKLQSATEATSTTLEGLKETTSTTVESLQTATNATASTLEELSESIKQTILSSDTLQPLMDNLNDLNIKIQELNESIKSNIGQAINITQTANATGGTTTGTTGALTGGGTNATNIINIIQGGQGSGKGNQGSTKANVSASKPSQWAGYIDNLVSSMVTGFENSKFGKVSLRGVFGDVINLLILWVGSKLGPVWGTIAAGVSMIASVMLKGFLTNFIGTLGNLAIKKSLGASVFELGRMPVNGIGGNLARSVFFRGFGNTLMRVLPMLGRFLGILGGLAVAVYGIVELVKGIRGLREGEKGAGWNVASALMFIVAGIAAVVAFVAGGWVPVLVAAIAGALGALFKWLGNRAKQEDENNKELVNGMKEKDKTPFWQREGGVTITNGIAVRNTNKTNPANSTSPVTNNEVAIPNDGKVRPVSSYKTTSGYGWRFHPIFKTWKWHSGIDKGLPEGTPIYSDVSGVVSSAGYSKSYGYNAVVKDALGNYHVFAHMKNKPAVKKGQEISRQTMLGLSGQTGYATGPHTHWGVFDNSSLSGNGMGDPEDYIKRPDFQAAQRKYELERGLNTSKEEQKKENKNKEEKVSESKGTEVGESKSEEKISYIQGDNDPSGNKLAMGTMSERLTKVGFV